MLKLVRNTLAEGGVLVDKDNKKIYWQYIVELQELQGKEGLEQVKGFPYSMVTKWIKVDLAAQVFSLSVADAIEYSSTVLKIKEFQNSEEWNSSEYWITCLLSWTLEIRVQKA